jgi:hypothetical protein
MSDVSGLPRQAVTLLKKGIIENLVDPVKEDHSELRAGLEIRKTAMFYDVQDVLLGKSPGE